MALNETFLQIRANIGDKIAQNYFVERVQKDNEPLEEAASLLAKAMKTKKSKKSFLIQTKSSVSLFDAPLTFEGMEIIASPALQIERANE